jgi:site-specific DNA-methyltransferase (adenine-specific)
MSWEKDNFANGLGVNKAPVSYFEDILVFSKMHQKHDFKGLHPLRAYFLEEKQKAKLTDSEIKKTLKNILVLSIYKYES